MKIILYGQLPAKKNAWKVGRYGRVYQSKQNQLDVFIMQILEQKGIKVGLPYEGRCKLLVDLFQSDRCDLDGQLTTLCDLLQNAGIVKNDRQIKQITAQKFIDNKEPKISLEIIEI